MAGAAVEYLAAVPLAGGHTLYNAALRRMHPAAVNIIASTEVIGGILLAWLILSEAPGVPTLVGRRVHPPRRRPRRLVTLKDAKRDKTGPSCRPRRHGGC